MIFSQVLAAGSLLIWVLTIAAPAYALGPGLAVEPWTYTLFLILLWSYPVVPTVLVSAAWIAYTRGKDRRAAVLSGLSFAPPFLLYVCMLVGIWFRMALD